MWPWTCARNYTKLKGDVAGLDSERVFFVKEKEVNAVCDEGFSLTLLATVFRVNSWKGKEAHASFAGCEAENVSTC